MNTSITHNELQPAENKIPMNKSTKYRQLLATHGTPAPHRGRSISAFTTNPETKAYFPDSRDAYALRFHQVKLLIAVDQDRPCIDPLVEVKSQLGGIRRTSWLYLYRCLPTFSGKEEQLAELMALNNAILLCKGIEKIILGKISSGEITDASYAARVLDEDAFLAFADTWLEREQGNRSKATRSK